METAEELLKEVTKEETKEETKEKVKKWLNNKSNLYFLGIVLFAIAIRLYYFFLTNGQALWWDEAEYTAAANLFVYNIPYEISAQRLVFFQFLISLIFKLGLKELAVRFILVIIPSILIIFVTYVFVKDMYDKRIALITTLMTSVFWIHLFYSMRIMNDELGFLFGLLALFLFWKGYIKGKNNKLIYLSALFIALSFLIRPAGIFYAGILVCFLFVTEGFKFLKKPQLWAMPIIFFITLIPHLLWSHFYHGSAFAFRTAYGKPGIVPTLSDSAKLMFSFIPQYLDTIFFVFFLIGLLTLIPLFLNLDRIVLKGSKKYYADLFMLISILFIEAAFIFIIWDAENRWLMPMSVGLFVFTTKGILLIYDVLKKHTKKIIAMVFIILILASGTYVQLKHADEIIKLRMPSYMPVKEAGIWLKEYSNPGDVVFSRSWPQNNYYSERETFTFSSPNETTKKQELLALLKEKNTRFYMLSIFEPGREWMYEIPPEHLNYFNPIKIYLQSYNGQEQPILVIYEIKQGFYDTY